MMIAAGVAVGLCPKPTSHTGVVTMTAIAAEDSAGLVVVDSGMAEYMPGALEPALTLLGRPIAEVRAICSTHGHPDHTGGSTALAATCGATTYFAAADADLAGFEPDVAVRDGDRVQVADVILEVIATPGHTAGSVCYYEPGRRLLLVGDGVQGLGSARKLPVYYHSGRQYRAGLRRLLEIPIELLVTGHPLNWAGGAQYVFRGSDCHQLLSAGLDASVIIAAAVRRSRELNGDEQDWHSLRTTALELISRSPVFRHFDAAEPVEHDTDATLRSEWRGLDADDV